MADRLGDYHRDENRLAVRTEDHPLKYLDFEGEIPAATSSSGRAARTG